MFIYLVVNTFLLTSVGRGRGGRGGGMDGVTYVPWKVWGVEVRSAECGID